MKLISICIPCYNEESNIEAIYGKICEVVSVYKGKYDFEFIFADNDSKDLSQTIIRKLAYEDKRVKGIFNTRNFGPVKSNRNSLLHANGDAVISIVCDFQDPPELIPEFIKKWEEGKLVVCGQKTTTDEQGIKKYARKLYYKIIKNMAEVNQYEQVTGFALYDRRVIEAIRKFDNPNIALRYVLSYIGYSVELIPYNQPCRRAGKSSYNINRYFDFAITSLVDTSYMPIRIMTILGFMLSCCSFIAGVVYLIYKLVNWNTFAAGVAPILIFILFFSAFILFFMGILGEYIVAISKQVNHYSSAFVKEYINFGGKEDDKEA